MDTLRFLRKLLVIVLVFQLPAYGYEFAIDKEEWFVREKVGDSFQRVGKIGKGTKVEIPDAYIRHDASGNIDREATINFWLSKTLPGSVPPVDPQSGLYEYGANKPGYFVPVRVIQTGKGSTKDDKEHSYDGETVYLQVNFLTDKGKWLENTEDAPVVSSPHGETYRLYVRQINAASAPDSALANLVTAKKECPTSLDPQSPLGKLVSNLSTTLARIDSLTTKGIDNARAAAPRVASTFKKSCGGRDVGSFIKKLKTKSVEAGVPWQYFAGKLLDESQGNCRASHDETDHSSSYGLFQINTNRRPVKGCERPGDRAWLNNPDNNLSCAFVVYKEKVDILVDEGFDPSFFTSDNIDSAKVVAASFNGGQDHLVKAKRDLEAFNAKHGTDYDYRNWSHLRIFMLRGMLSNKTEKEMFGDNPRRRTTFSINNIAYAEKLFGTEGIPQDQTIVSIAESLWGT